MDGRRLEGGFDGGTCFVDGAVRRVGGPWSPSVRKFLAHLADRGFDGAPRPLGTDELGCDLLSYEVLRARLRENIDAMRVTARSSDVTYQRMLKNDVNRRLVLAFEGLDEV